MVDVGGKAITDRVAIAGCEVLIIDPEDPGAWSGLAASAKVM